ncbi:MAG: TMEM165/GDT1 family protein [Polyangiaceae bacterium]
MDLRLALTTFVTVFLAELGDKTQLATFTMAAGATHSGARWSVFAGSAIALVLSSLIAVTIADQVARRVNVRYLEGGAGVLLMGMGLYYLLGALRAG